MLCPCVTVLTCTVFQQELSDVHNTVTAVSSIHYSGLLEALGQASLIKYTHSWKHSVLRPTQNSWIASGHSRVFWLEGFFFPYRLSVPLFHPLSCLLSGILNVRSIINHVRLIKCKTRSLSLLCPLGQVKPCPHDKTPLRCESALWRDYCRQGKRAAKSDLRIETCFPS